MTRSRAKQPDVALLVDTATSWGRRLVHGIVKYSHRHGPWHLWIKSSGQDTPMWLPPGWHGDGIIVRVSTRDIARHVAAAGAPVVNVSAIEIPGADFPRVAADLAAVGRMAAEHLLDRGFRHFAYYGLKHASHMKWHYQGFTETISAVCKQCPFLGAETEVGVGARTAWRTRQKRLIQWLKTLVRPVAVSTWTPEEGREVIHACRRIGFLVPEEVAVLAADNDDVLCEACTPPLSGAEMASERIGYEAATLLDRMMHGGRPPRRPIFIEPTGVVPRQSTDTLAIDDPDLARAVAFIRSHAAEPIQVGDILRAVPVSRRWLERRFQEVLGRGPGAEIHRVHLDRAKRLLAESDLPVPKVADAAGFGSREHFARIFKSEIGRSPSAYRTLIRDR